MKNEGDPISNRPFLDIEKFIIPQESNFSSTLSAGKPKPPYKMTKIEAFYDNFIYLSKNINISALIQTLKEDGFWNKIYKACSEQGSVVVFKKIYFLYEKLLICAELQGFVFFIRYQGFLEAILLRPIFRLIQSILMISWQNHNNIY